MPATNAETKSRCRRTTRDFCYSFYWTCAVSSRHKLKTSAVATSKHSLYPPAWSIECIFTWYKLLHGFAHNIHSRSLVNPILPPTLTSSSKLFLNNWVEQFNDVIGLQQNRSEFSCEDILCNTWSIAQNRVKIFFYSETPLTYMSSP